MEVSPDIKLFNRKKPEQRPSHQNGFTLVEMIIVLLILLLLIGFALRMLLMTGYVERAADKKLMSETRQAVVAAQSLLDEKYAENDNTSYFFDTLESDGRTKTVISFQAVADLAEVEAESLRSISAGEAGRKAVVVELVYAAGGRTCTYRLGESGGTYECSPKETKTVSENREKPAAK